MLLVENGEVGTEIRQTQTWQQHLVSQHKDYSHRCSTRPGGGSGPLQRQPPGFHARRDVPGRFVLVDIGFAHR
jgi:hypothetical protein